MDDIRRFVQIDDIKRGLYMEARKTLQEEFKKHGSAFVCLELRAALFSMVPTINTFGAVVDKKVESLYRWDQTFFNRVVSGFGEMFPELIELFDGYAYMTEGIRLPVNVGDAWFAINMIEARIALIDFILSQ